MMQPMLRLLALAAIFTLTSALSAAAQRFELPAVNSGRWFKGNTHSHTINTDGDSPPEVVARWYKGHGFHFLVISDHDTITEPASLQSVVDSGFILVRGEEVTGNFQGAPVHLTAIGLNSIVSPRKTEPTLQATLQANVYAIRAAGGLPIVNHPNYRWALDSVTLARTSGFNLFELFNGHPHVHNDGGGGAPSLEQVWDQLLTSGRRIFGVASEDSHHFKTWGPGFVNPASGWIYVRASKLDPDEITRNLAAGDFYASTGVELQDLVVDAQSITITINPDRDFKYTTEFIGDGGRVLQRVDGLRARYQLGDKLTYVRARVTDSGGRKAWTQPVFVAR